MAQQEPDVTEVTSPNMAAMLRAMKRLNEIEEQHKEALTIRDRAVERLFAEDGLRPPTIARITGMSTSNVRRITDRYRWQQRAV